MLIEFDKNQTAYIEKKGLSISDFKEDQLDNMLDFFGDLEIEKIQKQEFDKEYNTITEIVTILSKAVA
ncbi:hypothetical protein Q5O14_17930 [Eubacteriaceae bacterium ES2]|nr:hypothetical protein Q5O14_17930 [Eubacteriaceae bacterium ES2]